MEQALAPARDQTPSERQLIAQVVAGDADLYRPIVERYHVGLLNYLTNLLGDADAADDVAQEAFVQAYRKLEQYNPDYAFSTWLYKIAANLSYRQLKATPPVALDDVADYLADDKPAAGEQVDITATAQQLRTAVAGLEPHYRQVISLYYWNESSYEEMAVILDRPIGTIRTWLHRAKDQLRKELDGQI